VPLQDQPFQVLALLLQHPGEVVTREELQHALWPADTFVEFEHGVNTAIKKLRQALGDSADNPRFIETLPRKGYRFIAPVTQPEATPLLASGATLPRSRSWWWPVTAGGAVLAGVVALWVVSSVGPAPQAVPTPIPLTSYLGYQNGASFSPDGNSVAFAWTGPRDSFDFKNFDIYVKLVGEDQAVRLTSAPEVENGPNWSPDGRWIAFSRYYEEGNGLLRDLLLVPAVGGPTHTVASRIPGPSRLSWHPTSRWLALTIDEPPRPPGLFLVSAETGERRQLTAPPVGSSDVDPAISPDGRTLVFSRSHMPMSCDLYMLELTAAPGAAGKPKRLSFLPGCSNDPVWWPDGTSILFSSGRFEATLSLWRMTIEGSSRKTGIPQRLPFGGAGIQYRPTISKQGRIAFNQNTLTVAIWRMDLSGSHQAERMPMSSTRIDHVARYSPDGRRIAFASDRSGTHELWLCNSDGSNTVKLTSFGGPYVSAPAWSPDGQRIAFDARTATGPNGDSYIHIIKADGGKPEALLGTENKNGLPAWSRDGKWIYFYSNRTGSNQVWKAPVSGGNPQQVTRRGGTYALESPDATFVYYLGAAAFGGPNTELWRVPAKGGEETRIVDSVASQYFDVTKEGIYFFSGWLDPSVRHFQFATGKVVTLGKIKGEVAWGLSVSPDKRSLLYSLVGPRRSVLMMVEGYR
jgi:Tol biopolymer transport system component